MSIIASIVLYKHTLENLNKTLNSLLYSPHIKKVILVDNDSSNWAENYAISEPKIIYMKSEDNFGFGYGHNLAINKYACICDYFLVCNPDIYFDQLEFDNFVSFVKTRNEGLFIPKIVYENGENQFGARLIPSVLDLFARRFSPKIAKKLDRKYLLNNINIIDPVSMPYLSGCFMLFDSEALLDLNGFDERFFMYMEDVDLSRRCASKFGTIYYPNACIVHIHEKGSHKNHKLFKAHLKSTIQYFNKWGWFLDFDRTRINKKTLQQFKNKM